MDRNYVTGFGSVDIYGFDSYPQSFDCSNPTRWKPVVETYRSYQDSLELYSPLFIPEFQAGAYDAWGATGYEDCRSLTGPEFESVFYLNNLAANIKMVNYYMVYGGTNWGQLAFPGTYTSYDYGSAISENRSLNEKYNELKRQSLFLRSSKQFYRTEVIGNSKQHSHYFGPEDSSNAFVTELRNPLSGSGFYIVRALNSTSTSSTAFRLNILTSIGSRRLPQITLSPRESRILVTDYQTSVESGSDDDRLPIKLLYTTSSVLLSASIGGYEVLYLFSGGDTGVSPEVDHGETALVKIPNFEAGFRTWSFPENLNQYKFQISAAVKPHGYREIKWQIHDEESVIALGSRDSIMIMTTKQMAGQAWNPVLERRDDNKTPESILIWGPWLVRNASITVDGHSGSKVLHICGDLEEGLKKEVIIYVGGLTVRRVKWNGKEIENVVKSTKTGFLSFVYKPKLFRCSREVQKNHQPSRVGSLIDLDTLEWSYQDSLPEIRHDFLDDQWIEATHEDSTNPYKKLYGKYYLYSCDYGYCNGATIWRGSFAHRRESSSFPNLPQLKLGYRSESIFGINLTIAGGEFFAASVWLNDIFLGSVPNAESKLDPKTYSKTHMRNFLFPAGSLRKYDVNVITVVQDSMGMDQTEDGFSDTVKHPRGILGYKFEGEDVEDYLDEITWKVQGQLGGFRQLPDPIRGIYNENGFHGIRLGWHLPLKDPHINSDWKPFSPIKHGLIKAGIGFYRTNIKLDFERGYDVMVSFKFREAPVHHGRYRVEFWINGWHMGKIISHLGPQTKFPVHEGILNYQGQNDFALTLWALDDQGARISGLELIIDKILEGGVGPIECNNPPYNSSRESFPF